jgi:DNA-binding transcriptional MerR regulator
LNVLVTDASADSSEDVADSPTGAAYHLVELAAVTGVSERTIRYYQSEKLLAKPDKHGRDGVYRESHIERIRLIIELRDRGLSLGTIRQLVANDNPARTVSTWLGIDATLSAPWSDDRPRSMSAAELWSFVADAAPGLLSELSDARYIRADRDGVWNVPSPALLDLAIQLRAAGIDVDIAGRIRDLLRRRLAKAVDDTVELLVERAGSGFAGDATPDELATALGALRPITREMSSVILAQEVERALSELVHAGPRDLRRTRHR